VFKASRGIEDIYELTYIRKDGSRFPAVVSVTALRDAQDVIIGYLLIGTDNNRAQAGGRGAAQGGGSAESDLQQRQLLQHRHRCEGRHSNLQRRRRTHAGLRGCGRDEQDTPADISDPQEVIARAEALSQRSSATTITPGFEALVFQGLAQASRTFTSSPTSARTAAASGGRLGHRAARRSRRHHRLPADRHRQHRAQAESRQTEAAQSAPARPSVLHAFTVGIQHRRTDDYRSVRHHQRRQQADGGAHRLHA